MYGTETMVWTITATGSTTILERSSLQKLATILLVTPEVSKSAYFHVIWYTNTNYSELVVLNQVSCNEFQQTNQITQLNHHKL